jgi:hypothetical protein
MSRLGNLPHRAEFLITQINQLILGEFHELDKIFFHTRLDVPGRFFRIAVRAAERLPDDLVNDAEPQKVLRRQLQGIGRFGRLSAAFPKNRGTPFG